MHGTATATCHDFDLLEICLPDLLEICLPNAGTADCQPVLLQHLLRLLVRPLLRLHQHAFLLSIDRARRGADQHINTHRRVSEFLRYKPACQCTCNVQMWWWASMRLRWWLRCGVVWVWVVGGLIAKPPITAAEKFRPSLNA